MSEDPTPQSLAIVATLENLRGISRQITIVNGPLIVVGQGPIPAYIYALSEATERFTRQAQIGDTCPASDTTGTDLVSSSYRTELDLIRSKMAMFDVPMIVGPVQDAHRQMETALQLSAPGANVPTIADP